MASVPQDDSILHYRVRKLEEAVHELEVKFESKFDTLQGRITGLLITIAASAIVFALTVLAGTGRI